MVSPELIRRYQCFSGLSPEHIDQLAQMSSEIVVDRGYMFFREEDPLDAVFLLIEGEVAIVTDLPEKGLEVTTGMIVPGELFGWSGLLPPFQATASARANTSSRVLILDCVQLRMAFERDQTFAYILTQRIAQVIRDRLNGLRAESLAFSQPRYSGL